MLFPFEFPNYAAFSAAQVVPTITSLLEELETEFASFEKRLLENSASYEEIIRPFERINLRLEHAWGLVRLHLSVKNTPQLREAHQKVQGLLISFSVRIEQSKPFYDAICRVREKEKLSKAQKRTLDRLILDAKNAGIALEEEKQARFNEIQQRLAELSSLFVNNVLDATKEWKHFVHDPVDMEGLPQSARAMMAQNAIQAEHSEATAENGPWCLMLTAPSVIAVSKHAKSRFLREKIYRAYLTRASSGENDNHPLIDEILLLRAELAQLLGYSHFAAYSLSTKMASDVDAVLSLLNQVKDASWESGISDLASVKEFARREGIVDFQLWDVAFYAERIREKKFDYTEETLRAYFPMDRVLDGLFSVIERVFGVLLKEDPEAKGWNEDVTCYQMFDLDGTKRAELLMDPYARPADKRSGAWMDGPRPRYIKDRADQENSLVLPLAYIAANFTPPLGEQPALLTFSEVKTLFHEFGHALQHMLTEVDEVIVAGIEGIEWDAVEVASMFLEEWIYVPSVLENMARHYETGERIPESLMNKLLSARSFHAASFLLRQITFGLTDMMLHSKYDPAGEQTPLEVQRMVQNQTNLMSPLPEARFLCGFQHIFTSGYAAGYYSYMWANVMAADMFSAFLENGIENDQTIREFGRHLRKTLYSKGGSEHPSEIFRQFRKRDPQIKPMLERLGLSN